MPEGIADQARVAALVSMGFDERQARKAGRMS
jgi:Holliday junction resolvasome RuvABC DNA-binding subunit